MVWTKIIFVKQIPHKMRKEITLSILQLFLSPIVFCCLTFSHWDKLD